MNVESSNSDQTTVFCPNPDLLRRAALGEIDPVEMESIAEHLSICQGCWQVIENYVRHGQQIVTLFDGHESKVQKPGRSDTHPVPLGISAADATALGEEFQVIRKLGRGGSGDVFECFDKRLNRSVAVKVLRADRFTPQQVRRIQHEARLQAKINHPNFVQIFEVGDSVGVPYITMELVDGGSIRDQIAEHPLSPRIAARLLADIAQAIDYVHQQNLIHRDLKPSNILLTRGILADPPAVSATSVSSTVPVAIPKIADFGLAKVIGETSEFSQPDVVVGTPAYLAPEQVSGKQSAQSPASDIYSLGVILYECLTGTRPFQADTVAQTLAMIETATPVSPRLLQPGVNRDLETICLKCLSKDPGHRYPTALAMAEDLRRFLEGRSITARPTPAITRLFRWSRRNRALATAIVASMALSAILVVGSLIFAWEQQRLKQIADDKTIKARVEETRALESEHRALESEKRALDSEAKAISLRERSIPFLDRNIDASYHLALLILKLDKQEIAPDKLSTMKGMAINTVKTMQNLFFADPELVEAAPKLAMLILYQTANCEREAGELELSAKHYRQLLEFSRSHPSNYFHQQGHCVDSLNFIAMEHYRVENKVEGLAAFAEAWEICRDMPLETFLMKEKGFYERMAMTAENYIYALRVAGSEETASKVTAEVDELKKRIADANAQKKE